MRKIQGWIILLFSTTFFLFSCKKDLTEDVLNPANEESRNTNINNPRLSYGDSLFFLKNQTGNYTILPVSRPNASGIFKSIPIGLVIDSVSGRINITQSETGIRYKIYYVAANETAIDSVKLVISGIDYKDAIYEIARTPNAYDTAFPIYNARPGLVLPCGDDDEDGDGSIDDDDNQCVFDETDVDDDGNDDIPGVIQDKLLVDIKKGTIDVEASFNAGIFGSTDPGNGVNKDFTFYYRLQDASNRALNKITVRVYHFNRVSDIPQSLLDTLNLRNSISTAVNSRSNKVSANVDATLQTNTGSQNTGIVNRIQNLEYYQFKPKRPPIIIIVSQ